MILKSKDGLSIIRCEEITSIFIGGTGTSIKVNFVGGSGQQLGVYDTIEAARIALDILGERMANGDKLIAMPDDKDIQARLAYTQKNDRFGGKKAKSHGGS